MGMSERKRLIKLARRIPEAELVSFLTGNGATLDDWRVEGGSLVCRPHGGRETVTAIDDDVLAFALVQFIQKHKVGKP
jgi:hypothetical protein